MTLRVLLTGMAGGYALALLSTAIATYLLVGAMNSGRLDRWIDSSVPRALISIQIMVGATAVWMLVGTGLAALYLGGNFAGMVDGLGSPSLPFTAIVVAMALAPLPLMFVINAGRWWIWLALAAAFAVLFGWILPLAGE